MPDISMCMNIECDKRKQCYRSYYSGTKPSHWQSYGSFAPDENGECKAFWDKDTR